VKLDGLVGIKASPKPNSLSLPLTPKITVIEEYHRQKKYADK